MKSLDELNFPDDIKYSKDHEWVRTEGDLLVAGISDYAQDQLGDIVFVELPEKGSDIATGEEFGSVESVKAVSELFMPVGGQVVEVNASLEDSPEMVNEQPYGKGWMVKIKPADMADQDKLMDRDAYIAMLKG